MLKHGETTDLILKSFYEVYNEMGDGFLESVYEHALYLVLRDAGLNVERQKDIPVVFRGTNVGDFKADIIVDGKVIVELKAIQRLDKVHEAQVINYLKATGIEIALLLNFGPKPEFKRIIFNKDRNPRKSVAKRE
jgi:GxxExxY protein